MGYWVKQFVDGTSYRGTDEDIAFGNASWKKSRQKGIISASLHDVGKELRIKGIGEYWQSDQLLFDPITNYSKRISRRILRKIEPHDLFVRIIVEKNIITAEFFSSPVEGCVAVPEAWINKWFVLEFSCTSNKLSYYTSVEKG